MNPEIRQQWVDALRSGKYKQGQRILRQGDHFCCLGVLCDIIAPDNWAPMPRTEQSPKPVYSHRPYLDKDTYFEDLPSDEVRGWAGLTLRNPVVNIGHGRLTDMEMDMVFEHNDHTTGDRNEYYTPLSALNDAGISFTRIADLIEAQL